MTHLLAQLLLGSSVFLVPAAASVPVATRVATDEKAQTEAQKAADQAFLLQAFKSLEQELQAALADYSAAVQEARTKGLPKEAYPKVPTPDFFPRFQELALLDQPDALRWCLGTVSMLNLSMDETNSRKDAYYQRIVKIHPNSPWIKDIIRFLQTEGSPSGIGIDRAVPLLDFLAENSRLPGAASMALFTKSQLYQKSANPAHKALYTKALEELAARFPTSEEGKRAKGILFSSANLVVGKVAPDFKTTDVDGVEFKLSDYRGKVVVLDFWGFWCPNCVQMIPHEKEMVARLKDQPFALIGIATDSKKDDFKKAAAERGVTWRNSWQGSTSGPLCLEWGIERYPTIFVLDAKGVIRHVGLRGDSLSKAVDDLVAEARAGGDGKGSGK